MNQEQLEQVYNMLVRQLEKAVEANQALGREIDALRALKASRAREVEKLSDHRELISALMTPANRKDALKRLGADPLLLGDLVTMPGRVDGVAPGVVLEARASQG